MGSSTPDHDPEATAREPSPVGGAGHTQLPVELNALLGRGTRYCGKLHFDGTIRIEGTYSGQIRGEDVLVIGEGAQVEGDIEVGVCIVTGGTVKADIRAMRAIELHAPATVTGDLHAPAIFIDRGAKFEGNCKMAPLSDARQDAAAAELAAQPSALDRPPTAQNAPTGQLSAEHDAEPNHPSSQRTSGDDQPGGPFRPAQD